MKLMAVTVLYQKKIEELPFYPLFPYLKEKQISLLIYDNSPTAQAFQDDTCVTYVHDKRNIGLVPAYNLAFQLAKEKSCEGLLLLDHDTSITKDYLALLQEELFQEKTGSMVPQIKTASGIISPLKANQYINHNFEALLPGKYAPSYMAINSGSVISVSALEKIGGFNEEFPLDFLDHWLFFALGKAGYEMKVLPQVIDHDLSVLDYGQVSHRRYESILKGETTFYTKHHQELLSAHKTQLLKRTLKQFLKVSDKHFYKRTFKEYRKLRKIKL